MLEHNENERDLIGRLDALRSALAQEAPPIVKTRLQAAFRRHASRKRAFRWAGLSAVAAFASLLLVCQTRAPQPPVRSRPATMAVSKTTAIPVAPVALKLMVHHHPKKSRPTRRSTPVFIALDDSPVETGVVVRVKTDEIEAEVLLGEDGQAHAVRFLR